MYVCPTQVPGAAGSPHPAPRNNEAMRVLAALGALLFLYLAIIPAGLIYSTFDSACDGDACETTLLSQIFFTALYGACLAAILGTAGLFAAYAARGTLETQQRLPRALAVTGSVVGIAVFALFVLAFPLGGAIALTLAVAGYALVRLKAARDGGGGSAGLRERAPISTVTATATARTVIACSASDPRLALPSSAPRLRPFVDEPATAPGEALSPSVSPGLLGVSGAGRGLTPALRSSSREFPGGGT